MIKKSFLDKIKKQLTEEKNALLSKSFQNEIDIDGDEVDEIQGSLIALVNSKLSTMNANKLKQIDVALNKIKNKSFGSCEDCGDMISEKRLQVNPYFLTCISCAEEREMELRQKGRSNN